MARLAATALLLPLLLAAEPAAAQSNAFSNGLSENRWKTSVEAEPRIARRGLKLPVISYTGPDGSLKLKRGIVAGIRIAPNANLGIGLFETLPKTKQSYKSSDNPMEKKQRRSRKAALGFSLDF